jgi:hypothetical protein
VFESSRSGLKKKKRKRNGCPLEESNPHKPLTVGLAIIVSDRFHEKKGKKYKIEKKKKGWEEKK